MKQIALIAALSWPLAAFGAKAQGPYDPQYVTKALQAACPDVVGVSFGSSIKSTWRIDYLPTATQACKDAAVAARDALGVQQNVIPFSVFIQRWTDAEYLALMRARANAITAGNIVLVRQWDTAASSGSIDLNTPAAQNFKATMVSAGILTQVRADAIFQ